MLKTPIGGPLRRDLEAALTTDEFRKAFEELKTKDEVFGRYPTVEALLDLCQPGAPDPEGRDRVLGAILRALKDGNAIFPLLHLMFWRSLEALYRRLARRTLDPESLFEMLQWEFFQVVKRHDPDRQPGKIDVHLFLNTKKRILQWERGNHRERQNLGKIMELERAGLPWKGMEEVQIPPEDLEAFLLDLLQRGILNALEHDLLLQTSVYRRTTLKRWARAKKMASSTACELRQKVFRVIQEHLVGGKA